MPSNKFTIGSAVMFAFEPWMKNPDRHRYYVTGYMQNAKGDWIYSLERIGLKHLKAAKEESIKPYVDGEQKKK